MRFPRRFAAILAGCALALAPVLAAAQSTTALVIKDGNGTSQNNCAYTVSSLLVECHAPLVYDGTDWHVVYSDTSGRLVEVGAGTAGSPAGGVVSIQGVSGGTGVPVTGTFWQTTQPVSGTVTANAGTGTFTVAGADPCMGPAKSFADFESTTSGGSIVAAASGKKTYVCSISIVTSAAANVSIIEGTGTSVCTGGTTAGDYLNTGVTAANGAAFAANSGLSQGSGVGALFANATADQNTCVVFTTTNSPQVNVHVSYVQQ